jgi:hypothetical protein
MIGIPSKTEEELKSGVWFPDVEMTSMFLTKPKPCC